MNLIHTKGAMHPVWLLWKLHRFCLKTCPFWFPLRVSGDQVVRVRYLAEGRRFCVFRIKDRPEVVLRISKRHMYGGYIAMDDRAMRRSLGLYDELADWGLAPRTQALCGEAHLVQCIPELIESYRGDQTRLVGLFFRELTKFSLAAGIIPTDFSASNFGVADGRLILMDIDETFACKPSTAKDSPEIRHRLGEDFPGFDNPESVISAFYTAERDLLVAHLKAHRHAGSVG